MGGLVEYVAARAFNNPSVDSCARKAHANQVPNQGLVDKVVWDDVVEWPIHVW